MSEARNREIDRMLTGKFIGTFDDEQGDNFDEVILNCNYGLITGDSITHDRKKLWNLNGAVMDENEIFIRFESELDSSSKGAIVFKSVTKDLIKGIYINDNFENLQNSCGNYVLKRVG